MTKLDGIAVAAKRRETKENKKSIHSQLASFLLVAFGSAFVMKRGLR